MGRSKLAVSADSEFHATPSTPPPAREAEYFDAVPLADISESPTNPRKHFDDEKLAELAASIGVKGVLQPLLARPAMAAGQVVPGKYELIFGHRRFKAARLAGLATVPLKVTSMGDAEVVEVQLVENDSREDLSPLERANGYRALRTQYGYTAEQIAEKVGKSKRTVYATLQLGDLILMAKKAMEDGELSAASALVIARFPAKVQPGLLERALEENYDGFRPSSRHLQELAQRDFMLDLAKAQFDQDDAELVKSAGACTNCPKRTGAQPELFEDAKGPDLCLDLPCFRAKQAAWLKLQEKAGRPVLSEAEVKKTFYSNGDQLTYNSGFRIADEKEHGAKKTFGQLVDPAKIVLAKTPAGNVVELVKVDDLPREKSSAVPAVPTGKSPEDRRRERETKVRARALLLAVDVFSQDDAVKKRGDKFLRLLAIGLLAGAQQEPKKALCKRLGLALDGTDADSVLMKHLEELDGAVLSRVLVHLACAELVQVSHWSQGFGDSIEAAAELMDVDLKELKKRASHELAAEEKEKAKAKKGKAA